MRGTRSRRRSWWSAPALSVLLLLLPASASQEDQGLSEEEQQAERQRLAEEAFAICDLDGNGWISAREAEASLAMGRSEFRIFDTDQDGRIRPDEFLERFDNVMERLGVAPSEDLREVDTKKALGIAPTETEARGGVSEDELLRIYDMDANGALQRSELDLLMADLKVDFESEEIVRELDLDESGELELGEVGRLAVLVDRRMSEDAASSSDPLTALVAGSGAGIDDVPEPVGHFHRLDANGDGAIDANDLRTLSRGGRIPMRPGVIIGALDTNADGRIDEREFWRSMGRELPPAPPR